jgi:hypothetical protein
VGPLQGGQVRIEIGEAYLDEVQIRLARSHAPNTLSYLSFPAHRHAASVEQDQLVVSTQAATAVTLFAQGILLPIGGSAVTVRIDGEDCGLWLLDAVEADHASPLDITILLRFRPAAGPSFRSGVALTPDRAEQT